MIYNYKNNNPKIHPGAFISESADIIGNVILEEDTNIWFGAVVRGDGNSITIKKGVNIQDNCTIHITRKHSVYIGEYSSIGHNSVVHGAKIGKHSLIGMGSIILDGAEIGDYTIIGAGSLIVGDKKIPGGVLCMGSPAKIIREITEEERKMIEDNAYHYIEKFKEY